MSFDLEIQRQIDEQIGEPAVTKSEVALQDIAQKLKAGELPMPDGFKIQVSDWTPLELRNGFVFGREMFGYYPSGWMEAAIAYQGQKGKLNA